MASGSRRRAVWATLAYWTGQATGALVTDGTQTAGDRRSNLWRRAGPRLWNAACAAAVTYRMCAETWPATARAAHRPQSSCYDTVCGGVWCVYACVYFGAAWLDRASEMCALAAAATWRRRWTAVAACTSTLHNSNSTDTGGGRCTGDRCGDDCSDVPWHAYLIVAFPLVQFSVAVAAMPPVRDGAWRAAAAAVAAVASCAPVVAHGTAAALLVAANCGMRSINCRIVARSGGQDEQRAAVALLAREHWTVAELVTGGVCRAYGVDLVAAVLLAAVRVTYVAVSVFQRLTQNVDTAADDDALAATTLAVVAQLIAWFGQFAYLAYTCDELTAQSSEMFDNLNTLLLDIFKKNRLSGETYSSKIQEIEAVQEFMRQVVARKVIVHACGGLIILNLSLITTMIGVTLTYFIVLLQFESSHSGIHNNTINQ